MSKRRDVDLLNDISESVERINKYIQDFSYADFLKDIKTQDAIIRNIEVIGEAVKALSIEIKDKNPDVPWKKISGMRDKLIHDYFGVNIDIVWTIITVEIPKFSLSINNILKK